MLHERRGKDQRNTVVVGDQELFKARSGWYSCSCRSCFEIGPGTCAQALFRFEWISDRGTTGMSSMDGVHGEGYMPVVPVSPMLKDVCHVSPCM